MKDDIQVNIDVTPEQITANTGDNLQILIKKEEDATEYVDGDVTLKGNFKKVTQTTTTLGDLKARRDTLISEIAAKQAELDEVTQNIADASPKVDSALQEVMSRPQVASPSDPQSVLVGVNN